MNIFALASQQQETIKSFFTTDFDIKKKVSCNTFYDLSEKASKNVITCTICTDLIELVDEQILANSTIEQVNITLTLQDYSPFKKKLPGYL